MGAAVATGDGEDILRVCLSHVVVELMRTGKSPQQVNITPLPDIQYYSLTEDILRVCLSHVVVR